MTKVLLVEDETITAMLYKTHLKNLKFDVCEPVASGEEAVQKVGEESPDIVLMDIGLYGEMDGIEAAQIIKTRHCVPVIFVTGYADKETRERADRAVQHSGFYVKPMDPEEIKPAINAALQ